MSSENIVAVGEGGRGVWRVAGGMFFACSRNRMDAGCWNAD